MTIFRIINEARNKGIKLWVKDQQLQYKAPKGALNQELHDCLVKNKEEIVDLLSQMDRNKRIPEILPIERTAQSALPVSYAQQRLWFIDQLKSDKGKYQLPLIMSMEGDYSVQILEEALNLMVARHESFRTKFVDLGGQPHINIVDNFNLKLESNDVSHLYDGRDRAMQFCNSFVLEVLDIAQLPLLRCALVKYAESKYMLAINVHHIISDGWSLNIFLRELFQVYTAFDSGQEVDLPPQPIAYVDYSAWQHQWLESDGTLEYQLKYWKEKLRNVKATSSIATDFKRPAMQSFAGSGVILALNKSLSKNLLEFAENHNCTLYMVLLAAVKVLMFRYSGQTDICLGGPIANRRHDTTENVIGMFVNTLVFRSELSEDDCFTDVLTKVRKTCLEAYEHQDTPFEKVVDAVQPKRDLSTNPLFQVMVILQNTPVDTFEGKVQLLTSERVYSNVDVTFEFTQASDELTVMIEYCTDLYKKNTIQRMAGHLEQICLEVLEHPDSAICELEYLPESERNTLLKQFNESHDQDGNDLCLNDLFEKQCDKTPEQTALVVDGKQYSYRHLHNRACALALHLQSLGVGPDTIVGLCLERSEDLVVGMLGIVRAGGAYLPLDPSYPEERLSYMIDDCQAAIVLTQDSLVSRMQSLKTEGSQILSLDGGWKSIEQSSATLHSDGVGLHNAVKPNNLAYIIYTSGSTGKPKGVAIEHRNTVALVQWANSVYQPKDIRGVLASTSICFDLSVFEIFYPLLSGGTIILAKDALALASLGDRELVTFINTVPSAIDQLMELNAIPSSVKIVNLAGELLLPSLVDKIYATNTVDKVYDLYGPSEDTTYSTFTLRTAGGAQSIGRPITNTQVYILDKNGKLAPIGFAGEIYISGAGIARGYLNRPLLTAEKFIANPFFPPSIMYKTGDLARWSEDGVIEYLGRIDTQVKIRGFRIEVGEIETLLNQHEAIRESVVVARGEGASKSLVAFYVARNAEDKAAVALGKSELLMFLQHMLPAYMLPVAFVLIPKIPLTPNGKTDRKQLELIDICVNSDEEYVAARTESEKQLVEIWSKLLKIKSENVGVTDDFFEIGGHSLLATQLVSKIRGNMGVELPLATIFKVSTIEGLTEVISAYRHDTEDFVENSHVEYEVNSL